MKKKSTIRIKEIKELDFINEFPSGKGVKKPINQKYLPKIPYEGPVVIKNSFADSVQCIKTNVREALSSPNFRIEI